MTAPKTFYLIDGNGYVHRAYHALPPMNNSRGEPTQALFGFARMLQKILRQEKPDRLAVCFDTAAPTFRHKAYEEYKAHRKETEDALKFQLPLAREMVEAWGIPVVAADGFEADDLIATLALRGEKAGLRVVIVTSDKDAFQLVNGNISVLNEPQNLTYGPAEVLNKYGLRPDQLVDYFALTGDSADNVPGVAGIGPKTATQLLQTYGTLEKLLASTGELKGTLREKLDSHKETALLSRRLVDLDRNVPSAVDPVACALNSSDPSRLIALFQRFEFNALLNELISKSMAAPAPAAPPPEPAMEKARKPGQAASAAPPPEEVSAVPFQKLTTETRVVCKKADLDAMVKDLAGARQVAVNVKTSMGTGDGDKLVGVAFAREPGKAWYLPLGHTGLGAPEQLAARSAVNALKGLLSDEKVAKVGQNLKFQYLALGRLGVELNGLSFDVLVAAYCLNPRASALNDLTRDLLGRTMTSIDDLVGKGRKRVTLDTVDVPSVADYAGTGADSTLQLAKKLAPMLVEKKVDKLYYDIELPLIRILADMERTGTLVDRKYLEKLEPEFAREIGKIEAEIYAEAGQELNLDSPKQVAEVLFDKLKLPVIRRTKTGRSTDEEVLMKLAPLHGLPDKLLKYRELSKLKSTYIDSLLALIAAGDGRVHTHFNQAVTATGRLSSTDPNLQNIPIRTPQGQRIRRAFIAEKGNVLLSADYSQIDLRVLAHISGDAALREAFLGGEDVHSAAAREIFGLAKEAEVTTDQRRVAKSVNFGIAYGQTAFGLSQNVGLPLGEAQRYIDRYFARYAGVKKWIELILEKARKDGYVTTLLHRIRYLPEIHASNAAVRQFAERTAMNTPIQGTSADIIKVAMRDVVTLLEGEKSGARMLLQVHDELLFEVPARELDGIAPSIRKAMQDAIKLDIPLVVDLKKGVNWSEMEKF